MKVTREKTENCQTFLTIEMEPAELEESLDLSYRHLAEKADIPGFRKGKAPRAILERYLGKEKVLEDALELDKDYLELCEEVKRVVPVQKSFATFGYFVKTFCLLASSFSLEYWMHMTDTYDWKYTSILGLLFA